MRILAALVLLALLPCVAFGQGSATVTCTPPTKNTDGTNITGTISYRFYRGTVAGTYPFFQSSTTCSTVFTGLAVGTHYFVVTAIVNGIESGWSMGASKTITAPPPPTPESPTNITVTSTRIEPSSWTCRDQSGAILSSHERQDKAQESCTNIAIAALIATGQPAQYEMRPSGYRIAARF